MEVSYIGMVRRWNVAKQEGVIFTHEAMPDLPGVHQNAIRCRAADVLYKYEYNDNAAAAAAAEEDAVAVPEEEKAIVAADTGSDPTDRVVILLKYASVRFQLRRDEEMGGRLYATRVTCPDGSPLQHPTLGTAAALVATAARTSNKTGTETAAAAVAAAFPADVEVMVAVYKKRSKAVAACTCAPWETERAEAAYTAINHTHSKDLRLARRLLTEASTDTTPPAFSYPFPTPAVTGCQSRVTSRVGSSLARPTVYMLTCVPILMPILMTQYSLRPSGVQ